MVSSVNTHTNATSKRWHLWEIDLRFAPGLPPGWLGVRSQLESCARSAPRTPSAAPVRWTVLAGSLAGGGLVGGFARPKQGAHPPACKAAEAALSGIVFSGMWGVTLMVLDGWPAIHGAILSVITMAERSHRSTRVPCFLAELAKVGMNDPSPFTVQASSPSPAPRNIFSPRKLIYRQLLYQVDLSTFKVSSL